MSNLDEDLVKNAAEVIGKLIHITVATCDKKAKPWNTPVYAAYDENLAFYWTSSKNGQHSQNIRNNEQVFIVIYDACGGIGSKHGVYMEATAKELANAADIRNGRTYTQRRKGKAVDDPTQFMGESDRRVYKATPTNIWMNGYEMKNGVYARDVRRVVDKAELLKELKNS